MNKIRRFFGYLAFPFIVVACMTVLIAKELSIPVRKWWHRTFKN